MSTSPGRRRPAECFPLGEFLQEEMDARSLMSADVALESGLPILVVEGLLDGSHTLTPDEAAQLIVPLDGISPEFWLNVQESYRAWIAQEQS